jgi:FkbM family methyltransferase
MGSSPRSDGPRSPSQVQRGLNFLLKRTSGLYFRDILRNQQEILRRQEALGEQLRDISQIQAPRQSVYMGDNKVLTRLQTGHKIYVDTRDRGLTPHIVLDGFWEADMTRVWLDNLRPGMTVIDVGANVGYYTLLAADRVGQNGCVVAFEPDPRLLDLLFATLDINGYRSRCRCVGKAVAGEAGRATFYKREKYPINNSLWNAAGLADSMMDEVTSFEVELVNLDDFVRDELGGRTINLVKIDAEGAESIVLQGMKGTLTQNKQITVLCEFNAERVSFTGSDPAQTLSFLESLGFGLLYVYHDGTVQPISREQVLNGPEITLFLKRPG